MVALDFKEGPPNRTLIPREPPYRNNRTFPRLLSSPAATRSATILQRLPPRLVATAAASHKQDLDIPAAAARTDGIVNLTGVVKEMRIARARANDYAAVIALLISAQTRNVWDNGW